MSRVIAYGEDALTLWACTRRLANVLQRLDDNTSPDDCLFFYRPSFGRKGGPTRSEFGEFDGILATRKSVYAIESKRFCSAVRGGVVPLKACQVLRHKVFQWLRSRWLSGMGWVEFVAANATDFGQEFEQKPLARPGTKLADNIERTLNLLADYPDVIRHVVLAFYQEERHAPQSVAECGLKFQVVGMTCDSINTAGMFYMPP